MLPQLGRAHEDAQVVSDTRGAAHADAEGAADRAVPAAAVDDVLGGDLAALVARQIMCGDDDAVALLGQLLEAAAAAQFCALEARREIAQDRVEPELIAALGPLGLTAVGPLPP
jgi:hypothetical protein